MKELADAKKQFAAKAQQPVRRHQDQTGDATAQNIPQQSLEPLLAVVHAAAQVGHDLDVCKACVDAMLLESRGLSFELFSLVVRRDAGVADRLADGAQSNAQGEHAPYRVGIADVRRRSGQTAPTDPVDASAAACPPLRPVQPPPSQLIRVASDISTRYRVKQPFLNAVCKLVPAQGLLLGTRQQAKKVATKRGIQVIDDKI